ncbi:uncharacterized protein [Clytia hemisphaerica]|uniref:Uncharacterized protein n=1 Tax=Clytia hemisphaerica TaxID=252671 RepID=A0A7M5VBI9_9CNID
MKNMRQIARPASVDEEKDQTDAAATKYKNFNNRKTSGSTVSSDDQNTVGEFINPVYRDSSIKRDDQNNISQKDKEAYDSLNFRSDSKASQQNGHPARTDITKPPGEEIEMGVHNYGYGDNEKARPNSWDKSISTFSPYAVDTPIGGPVESQSNTGLSVQDKRNSISKGSEYSFIGEENPYAAPSIKNPDYDTIPGLEKGRLPPPRQGTRKTNLAYESAVIKHTEVRKTVDKSPKEGYAAEEGSSCCHVIFTILVGLLALIAIVVVFLVVFGVISAKKCKECDVQVPSTDSQTGGQNGNDANKAILAEIEALRNNLTALHKAMANNPKPVNQTGTIILLQNEVSQQKLHVQTLTNELAKQRNLTSSLNQTFEAKKLEKPGPVGLQGINGVNGTSGAPGPRGPGPNLKECTYVTKPSSRTIGDGDSIPDRLVVDYTFQNNEVIVGGYCSSSVTIDFELTLREQDNLYLCTCTNFKSGSSKVDCHISLFRCPKEQA